MDIKKLNSSVDLLKESLGDALIACDIWLSGSGQSIAGHNPQPKATALFEQVTGYISKALNSSGFPPMEDYYLLDLSNGAIAIILLLDKYQWGMLVNKEKVSMGLLLNVVIPNVKQEFAEAVKG